MSGPSFPVGVKLLATAMVVALIAFGSMAMIGPSDAPPRSLSAAEWASVAAVAALVAAGYWGILTSRTGCDGECIEQTWLWRKKVRIADIAQVKLISVSGLDWLVVPRLVVRTGFGLTTFQTADPAVLARFRQLARGG